MSRSAISLYYQNWPGRAKGVDNRSKYGRAVQLNLKKEETNMELRVLTIKCANLQNKVTKFGDRIKHIIHSPNQCAIGILTDRMILVVEFPDGAPQEPED